MPTEEERRPLLANSYQQGNDFRSRKFSYKSRTIMACVAILLTVVFERIAFYGLVGNFVMFLNQSPLGWFSYNAVMALFVFTGLSYMTAIFGGWIADSCTGKFRAIVLFFVIYIAGYVCMPLLHPFPDDVPSKWHLPKWCPRRNDSKNDTSLLEKDQPFVPIQDSKYRSPYEENCFWLVFVAIFVIALGNGSMKCNIAPFGADQVRMLGSTATRVFFNWYYWSVNLGALISIGIIAYIQQEKSYFWGYVVPNISLVIALLVFISGVCVYVMKPPNGSILSNIAKILCEACRMKCCRAKRTPMVDTPSMPDIELPSGPPQGCLDLAKIRYGGSFHDSSVDDVKSLGKVILVFLAMIPYWIVYLQMQTSFVIQGLHMKLYFNNDTSIHNFKLPAAWLSVFDILFLIVLLPLFDRVIYPALDNRGHHLSLRARICIGMVFGVAAVACAGGIETYRLEIYWKNNTQNVHTQIIAQSCNLVYLDGSESKGSPSVSVIAKYGRHTQFLFFRVWVPEIPLEIELSDNKLSQIKSWKAPKNQRNSVPTSSSRTSTRRARDVNFGILPDSGHMISEDGMRQEEFSVTCNLRFQVASVQIYARFFVPDGVKNQYMVSRKALFRVTDLVKDRLRIADTSIAALVEGTVIEGLQPGRTEIQVVSQQGRVIGAEEVKVASDKAEIERLEVDVISGISLELHPQAELPGTLTAHVHTHSQLTAKYQEALLEVSVIFDDDTRMPLHMVPTSDYFLDVDALNNHIVAAAASLSKDTPKVIALGQGKGKLVKITLGLGDACQRKKSRPLAVSDVELDVDFEEAETPDLQNDAGIYGYDNRGNDKYGTKNDKDKGGMDGSDKGKERYKDMDTAPFSDHGFSKDERPRNEAQQSPIIEAQSMTPLEIGMYNLLGVFCLAIIAFMVNCIIFVVRYRNKRKEYKGREHVSQAPDWVWIGRATLERNAINTTCQQALMPDADFNGNHSLLPPSASTSNRNSASSSGGVATSNRNSMVSTYKGSECSIRITANPMVDENDNPHTVQEEEDEEDIGPPPPPIPPHMYTLPPPLGGAHSTMGSMRSSLTADDSLRRRKLAELEEAVASGSELEFDYESLGMTYEELMEYFDNLKESTA